jgi:alkyl sulfatase BDS1-like metallo-beta-lactamase superfamily hydrolase
MIFDYLAVRLNGPKADKERIELNWIFPDIQQKYRVLVNHGVLNYFPEETADKADATITLTRSKVNDLILGRQTFDQAKADGSVTVQGDPEKVNQFFSLLDKFNFWFNIITP